MDDADLIWNRACDPDYRPSRTGDRALQSILGFHGLSMNGGIAHALELDFAGSASVAEHYRLLGAHDLAGLVDEARVLAQPGLMADGSFDALALDDKQGEELDALDTRLPSDSDIEALFRRYLAAHPEDFDAP